MPSRQPRLLFRAFLTIAWGILIKPGRHPQHRECPFLNYSESFGLQNDYLIILEVRTVWRRNAGKNENLLANVLVVHTTKQVTSSHWLGESGCEMRNNANSTRKAYTISLFHCFICKFTTCLSPWSSWLLDFISHDCFNSLVLRRKQGREFENTKNYFY